VAEDEHDRSLILSDLKLLVKRSWSRRYVLQYGQIETNKGQNQCLENGDSIVRSCGFKKLLSSGK